jgi:hypothetical protein
MIDGRRILFSALFLSLGLYSMGVPRLHSQPVFDVIDDQMACEGDLVVIVMFADALFPQDSLDFEMEGAPEGAILENYGKCG